MTDPEKHPATLTAQAQGHPDPATGALIPPLYATTTYQRDPDNQYRRGWSYGRADNPTIEHPQNLLNALEGGAGCLLFASGMAAATTVFLALQTRRPRDRPQDHVLGPSPLALVVRDPLGPRGRPRRHLRSGRARCRHPTRHDEAYLARDAREPDLGDRRHRSRCRDRPQGPRPPRGRQHGRDPGPHPPARARRRPRHALGDQIPERPHRPRRRRARHRPARRPLDPFFPDFATTPARSSAPSRPGSCSAACARFSSGSSAPRRPPSSSPKSYEKTRTSPPSSTRASRTTPATRSRPARCRAASAACSRSASESGKAAAIATAANVSIWQRATSLGGIESLIEHRASIEGPDSPVPPDLLRLSVGIEHAQDLLADLEQALTSMAAR